LNFFAHETTLSFGVSFFSALVVDAAMLLLLGMEFHQGQVIFMKNPIGSLRRGHLQIKITVKSHLDVNF
jgi:hypothetical protein